MAQSIREVMTADPRTVEPGQTVVDAAREMRDGDVGDVLVTENGRLVGILTDRDIAVRVVAEGRDPQATTAGDACTRDPVTLTAPLDRIHLFDPAGGRRLEWRPAADPDLSAARPG